MTFFLFLSVLIFGPQKKQCWGATSCLEITLDRFQGSSGILGIKPKSATFKANAQSAVLLLRPWHSFFLIKQISQFCYSIKFIILEKNYIVSLAIFGFWLNMKWLQGHLPERWLSELVLEVVGSGLLSDLIALLNFAFSLPRTNVLGPQFGCVPNPTIWKVKEISH